MAAHAPDCEQPESRARVLAVLQAHQGRALSTTELCALSGTTAAPRRAWELQKFYGYRLLLAKVKRNQWTWEYLGAEAWALPPSLPCGAAKRAGLKRQLEATFRAAIPATVTPTQGGLFS